MERYTVTATTRSFNSSLSQKPTFQTADVTPTYTAFQSKPNLRDASFSSYLRPDPAANPKTSPPAAANRTDDTEISIFDAERYFNENQDQKQMKTSQPLDQIVERCDLSPVPRLSSVSSVDGYGRNYRTGSFHATPTASSEASWNSQSGLLSNPPGSIPISLKTIPLSGQRRGSSSSTKWLFGRNCPCSGKKSVEVKEKFPESRNPAVHLNSNPNGSVGLKKQSFRTEEAVPMEKEVKESEKEFELEEMTKLKLVAGSWAKGQEATQDSGGFPPENGIAAEIGRRIVPSGRSFGEVGGFTFPILNPPANGKLLAVNPASPLEEPPRESLEVFQPAGGTGLLRSTEFQQRSTMPLQGENGRRSFAFPASPKGRDDDVASDSSSDLFEIESFSTQATSSYPLYRRRDSLDEVSSFEGRRYGASGHGILQFRRSLDETTSIAPTEFYEPSEASVDWSVTTAEGFDRSSLANFSTAASEYEEVRFMHVESGKDAWATAGGGAGKRKGNGLLSCRCEKAVSVGPHPVKCGPDHNRAGGPPSFPTESSARITAMSRLAHISSTNMARMAVSDKPPMARSHSARITRTIVTR